MRITIFLAALALAGSWTATAAAQEQPGHYVFVPYQTFPGEMASQPGPAEIVAPPGASEPVMTQPGSASAGATVAAPYGPAPWHAGYYHTMYGRPLPLVVPPTAQYQTNWGWGIGNTRVTPIYPQFSGPYNGYAYEGYERWRPTPDWPTDTLQFGVYYVRGPFGDNPAPQGGDGFAVRRPCYWLGSWINGACPYGLSAPWAHPAVSCAGCVRWPAKSGHSP
jgi:hypothetical protein